MSKDYTVKQITERARLAANGAIEKMYHIEAVSAGGTYFTLDLTEAETDPKRAAEILTAKAKQLDRLKEL